MTESLLKLLTPKRRIDIIRDVMEVSSTLICREGGICVWNLPECTEHHQGDHDRVPAQATHS